MTRSRRLFQVEAGSRGDFQSFGSQYVMYNWTRYIQIHRKVEWHAKVPSTLLKRRCDKSNPMKADDGIDAPRVVVNLLLAGIASIIAGIILKSIFASIQPLVALILLIWGLLAGTSMSATALLMIWSSKVGKLQLREKLIDSQNPLGRRSRWCYMVVIVEANQLPNPGCSDKPSGKKWRAHDV